MSENLLVTRAAGVMEITFNRPEKKNALTRDMYAGVVDALRSADADPAIRATILTGTGDTFTSGNDIKDFQVRAAAGNESPASPFLTTLSTIKKPLIGAVIGVGTTILAHCDAFVEKRKPDFSRFG